MSWDEIGDIILPGMSAERRLKGLSLEERLKGMTPEDRLKGLSEEERQRLLQLLLDQKQKQS